jgi:hypothetical protein
VIRAKVRAKVIDLPKEGLTSGQLEKIINDFIDRERPSEIVSIELSSEYGLLIIIYKK